MFDVCLKESKSFFVAKSCVVFALKQDITTQHLHTYRDGGMRGLFMGMGPRVARAGPSVGIVVSFYEVVKYVLHRQYASS